MTIENREDLLVLVASLYYEHDYNQQQIADRLNISRSNISRLLKEAKQKGLVEVRIRKPISTVPELEREFVRRFGLHHAMIIENRGRDLTESLQSAGQLAARYLEEILNPGDVLAISWGTGVGSVVDAISRQPARHVDIVQMIGSVGSANPLIDGPELARRLADNLGGRYYYLHAPLFVENQTVRDMLLDEPAIRDGLNRARRANVALLGVGTTEPQASSFVRAGHLTEAQLADLRAQGVVGETAGQHFDIQGSSEGIDINHRVIALDLKELWNIPHVLTVACGLPKRKSILGALRGGYIKALATDEVTARAVLEEVGVRQT